MLQNIYITKDHPYKQVAGRFSVMTGQSFNVPVVHHSLPAQFIAKVIKRLFPVNFQREVDKK